MSLKSCNEETVDSINIPSGGSHDTLPQVGSVQSHNLQSHDSMSHDLMSHELTPSYDEPLQLKINQFTEKHKDVLERLHSHDNDQGSSHSSLIKPSMHGALPPLEYHMKINSTCRKDRLLQLLVPGQLVEGYIVDIRRNYGIIIEITSLIECPKSREVSDLGFQGLVKVQNLTKDPSKGKDIICEYQEDDVVRAIIIGNENEYVLLSFHSEETTDLKLGYVNKDLSFPKLSNPTDFIDQLTQSTSFRNPLCVDNLKSALGIRSGSHASLLKPILMDHVKDEEYYDSLRKVQRVKWSMDTVANGVRSFKSKQYDDALKHFNHALDIDAENVEALVARGALYANNGHYEKAISDFESALTLNHAHSNAKKYLVETQTAFGKELEKKGDIKMALRCYREALADSPLSEPAKTRAEILTAVLEKKAKEQREKERKRQEEEERLKKLQKIIDKEYHHHHHKKKRKKHKKSSKRRRDNSSSSDSNE